MTKKVKKVVVRREPAQIVIKKKHNVKLALVLMLIPLAIGLAAVAFIGSGLWTRNISGINNQRLETTNWQDAERTMLESQPSYDRKFAYYKVKEGQTVQDVAAYFSVSQATLEAMNPGTITYGTTIKVPPIEHAFAPIAGSNGQLKNAIVTDDNGLLHVTQKYRLKQHIDTTIPELMAFLAPYNAIEKTGPTSYRLNKALSLDGDIRLDMTPATGVTKFELRSQPGDIASFVMDQSAVLIDSVLVTTYDPTTGKADMKSDDDRAFVRMKNGRLDILNSRLSYLGNALEEAVPTSKSFSQQKDGGMYGVSWRISDDQLGQQITTGWVEHTQFVQNHYGAYTYGASGMMWKANRFNNNEIYGLDPHDDSNNAMIIDNLFDHNGKHGFIVSKRCNYNVIRHNTSYANKLHGYMLHQDSAYNLIEDNVAYGNTDNFVIYESNYNTIRDNVSYDAHSSHVRINKHSVNNYVTGNKLIGGKRGIYLYDRVVNAYIAGNEVHGVAKQIMTRDAKNVLFAGNTVDNLQYDIADGDRMIFGLNTIAPKQVKIPAKPPMPAGYRPL
jgi:parallel beta-helix repeat protein